jgi:hypothetical protein
MDMSLSFGRFIAGALISTLMAIGGVWFVVQQSIAGLQTAVETTNERIGDFRQDISRLDERIENLRAEMRSEFDKTREAYKKASLETGPNSQNRRIHIVELGQGGQPLAKVLSNLKVGFEGPPAVFMSLVKHPITGDNTVVSWSVGPDGVRASQEVAGQFGLPVDLSEPGAFSSTFPCAMVSTARSGEIFVTPDSKSAIIASDGFACRVN